MEVNFSSGKPPLAGKSCFGRLRGDTFFSTTVVLVTIGHILQLPLRVKAQLRVKLSFNLAHQTKPPLADLYHFTTLVHWFCPLKEKEGGVAQW